MAYALLVSGYVPVICCVCRVMNDSGKEMRWIRRETGRERECMCV